MTSTGSGSQARWKTIDRGPTETRQGETRGGAVRGHEHPGCPLDELFVRGLAALCAFRPEHDEGSQLRDQRRADSTDGFEFFHRFEAPARFAYRQNRRSLDGPDSR